MLNLVLRVPRKRPMRVERRGVVVAAVSLAAVVAMIAGAAPALAGTAADPVLLTGSATVAHETASGTWGSLTATADADISVDWSQPAAVQVGWTDNLVRQGRQLDPQVGYSRPVPGTMTVTYSVSASLSWDSFVSIGVSADISASGPCALIAGGSDYTCHLTSDDIGVLDPGIFAVGSPYVDLAVTSDVTVTPHGIDTLRTASFDGNPAGTAGLDLAESPITDAFSVPCTVPAGADLGYGLGNLSVTDGLSLATALDFKVGLIAPNPITVTPGFKLQFTDQSVPLGTSPETDIAMHGSGVTYDLGSVQPNNIAPTISVAPSFAGAEGSPIAFSASATGPCAAGGHYVWSFSDGGHEYGATVHHTFTDSGPYTGEVKITDTTGLTDTADFTVDVANLAPNLHVLPDSPTVAWGRPLTLQAQAVDPGAGDQSTLTYAWNFGDGSSITSGGPSETHEWGTPGNYDVTVTVCDKDGACTPADVPVTVRKRDTSVSYTGDTQGTYSASSTLSGALVDEYGQAVNGATLDFTLGGASAGSAVTGSNGTATRTLPVGLVAGSYSASAGFAGNARYTASGPATSAYAVSTMGTSLAYTGALSGSPNKAVPLAAKLTDNLGRALVGRTITFTVGSQTTTAVTNASGVASVNLVLNQKPNRYSLTVSWPGEAGKYDAASQSVSFSLNKK